MEFKDYYTTLGVTKAATEKEIKQAFRKLARKHPPRREPGRQGGRGEVQGDQRGLRGAGDPETRKKYDELGANWRMYEQAAATAARVPFGGELERGRRTAGLAASGR